MPLLACGLISVLCGCPLWHARTARLGFSDSQDPDLKPHFLHKWNRNSILEQPDSKKSPFLIFQNQRIANLGSLGKKQNNHNQRIVESNFFKKP